MPTSKIVVLLFLVAISIAVFYVRLWMERRRSQEKDRLYRQGEVQVTARQRRYE